MSVAVSAGAGDAGGDVGEMCGWRHEVRAKVHALKCHVMASRGLTTSGHIVDPYPPSLLLDTPASRLLLDAANLDLEAYAEVLQSSGYLNPPTSAVPAQNPPEPAPPEAPPDAISLKDVHLRLQDNPSSPSSPSKALQPSQSPQDSPCVLSAKTSPAKTSPSNSLGKSGYVNGNASREEMDGEGTDIEILENPNEELNKVKAQLRSAEAEVVRLGSIRDEVESELQELTANLFQEAHSMVHNANHRAATAEKSLREAEMHVEVLTAEVTALKALVITSTPAAPNPHLHPQLISKSVAETGKKIFQRGHRKSPSDFDLRYGRDTTPPSSPFKESRINDAAALSQFPLDPECWEVDPVVHKEFIAWMQSPTLERTDPFMKRIYEEDIDICLAFPNSILAHRVQRAIQDNSVAIEEANSRQKSSCPRVDPDETRKCVLLDVPRFCKYRFRLSESDDEWYYISQLARNRIIAICDFLNYLRYIKLGLVKSSIHDVYWELVKLRRQMALARLGF